MYPVIENALVQWVKKMNARGVFISGDIIQQKGVKVLEEVNLKLPEEKTFEVFPILEKMLI